MRNEWKDKKPGDWVKLPDGIEGVVAANFEKKLFGDEIEPGGWEDEKGGLLIYATFGSLVRYPGETLD